MALNLDGINKYICISVYTHSFIHMQLDHIIVRLFSIRYIYSILPSMYSLYLLPKCPLCEVDVCKHSKLTKTQPECHKVESLQCNIQCAFQWIASSEFSYVNIYDSNIIYVYVCVFCISINDKIPESYNIYTSYLPVTEIS